MRAVSTAELVISTWSAEVGCGWRPCAAGGSGAGCEEEFPSSGVSRGCMLVTGTWNRNSGRGVVSTAESRSERLRFSRRRVAFSSSRAKNLLAFSWTWAVSAAIWAVKSGTEGGVSVFSAIRWVSLDDVLPGPHGGRQTVVGDSYNRISRGMLEPPTTCLTCETENRRMSVKSLTPGGCRPKELRRSSQYIVYWGICANV